MVQLRQYASRLLEHLLPEQASDASPEDRRQAGVLVGLAGLMGLTGALYAPTFWLLDLPAFVGLSSAMCVALTSMVLLYRVTGARTLVAHGVLASIFIVLFSAQLTEGIEQTLVLPWLVIVPVYAVLLVGVRQALPWLLTTCLAYVLLCGLDTSVLLSDGDSAFQSHSLMALALRVGLAVVLVGVAWTHDALRKLALREQQLLERAIVAAREDEERQRLVAQAAHAMSRSLLDNVDHAILLVSADGIVAPEYSSAADRMLGDFAPGDTVWTVFSSGNPRFAAWLESCWESAKDDWMPLSQGLAQLPKQIVFEGRHLSIELRIIDPTQRDSPVLLVASDVSAMVKAREEEQNARGVAVLMTRSLADTQVVTSFVREGDRMVAGIKTGNWPAADQRRAIHTLKGSASIMGLCAFSDWLHALEDRMDAHVGCAETDRSQLVARWSKLARPLDPFLHRVDSGDLLVSRADMQALVEQVQGNASHNAILATLEMLDWDAARPQLQHLADRAADLAGTLGDVDIETRINCDPDLRFPPHPDWTALWGTLPHVIRNAIDHGIEDPDSREAIGKPRCGTLEFRAQRSGGCFLLEISDDGRGISWESVERRARAMGLPCDSQAELERAAFADGLSTAAETTQLSGRGVGLSAFWHAADRLGGRVEIDTQPRRGTTFRAIIPMVTILSEAREADLLSGPNAESPQPSLRTQLESRQALFGVSR